MILYFNGTPSQPQQYEENLIYIASIQFTLSCKFTYLCQLTCLCHFHLLISSLQIHTSDVAIVVLINNNKCRLTKEQREMGTSNLVCANLPPEFMVACYTIFLKILTEINSFFRSFAALQLLACVVHVVHGRHSHSITGNRHLTREKWRSRFIIPPQTHNTSPKTLGFNSIVGVGLCKRIQQNEIQFFLQTRSSLH